jgi:hypothetical protein
VGRPEGADYIVSIVAVTPDVPRGMQTGIAMLFEEIEEVFPFHKCELTGPHGFNGEFIRGASDDRVQAEDVARPGENLNRVSARLDQLAPQHPVASEALLVIAGTIRDSAVLLEVLVATKISLPGGLQ